MKKYIYIAIAVLIALLGGVLFVQQKRIKSLKSDVSTLSTNVSAYANENSILKDKNIEFQFSVSQLNYINDSLVQKMNGLRKELKIKDKQIERLGYIESEARRIDTVRFTDTLFMEKVKHIDTTIIDRDGWYKCSIGLNYPNEIVVEPSFKSEKYVITATKKETINPPKKTCIGRLFQRKHKVTTVEVVEKNPYIDKKVERFITVK